MKNPLVNSIATWQWTILVLIVWLHILTCKMFSSTIDCRRAGTFNVPLRLKQTFAFQPFRLFHHSFWGNYNSVSLHFRFLIYKWSPVYPTLSGRILHWQMARSKHLSKGILILSDLELPALPYVAPITAISRFQEYQLYYAYEIVRCPCRKMICDSQKYTRNYWVMQKGSPLTLCNHFIQPYRA